MIKKMIFLAALLLLLPSGFVNAQVGRNASFQDRLESAKDLYNNGMYVAAEQELDRLAYDMPDKRSLLYSEVMANKIMCAIALGRDDVDGLVKNLETDFPNDPQLAALKMNLASAKYDSQEYTQALVMYEGIQPRNLYKSALSEFYFKKSYCSIYAGKYDAALEGFQKVIGRPQSQYTYPSIYYSGYVNYLAGRFDDAFSFFEAARKDSRFALNSEYYMVESNFMTKDYDYTIANGPKLYTKVDKEQKAGLSRMVAESYFAKDEPQDAMKHLREYINSGATLSRKDRYFVGVLSYSLESWKDAVEAFKHVVSTEDELGQSAYYYSAECYLRLRNKVAALQSFKTAAQCSFDKQVQEDAFFNYAKLCYDVNSDISVFQQYVQQYPDSGKDDIINSYIATSSLEDKDYTAAIDAMRKISRPSDNDRANLQKALLLRAVELINNGSFRSAVPMLEESMGLEGSEMVGNVAKYYLAECMYAGGSYNDALHLQQDLMLSHAFDGTDMEPLLDYSIGYTNFKLDNFASAEKYFTEYLAKGAGDDDNRDKDAGLRLADAYFMQNNYPAASEQYEKVADEFNDGDLYPWYQSALAYGLCGKSDKKLKILEEAIKENKKSPLYMHTLYELGRTYVQQNKNAKATSCFNEIVDMRDSLFYAKSLLELGMINANEGKYQQAVSYYDRIVRQMPRSAEARDALAAMESVYEVQNKPKEFLAYLDRMGLSNVKTSEEKADMIFNAAEQIYYSQNYTGAVSALRSFIETYPNSGNVGKAYWYMAEAYRKQGRKEYAADAYEMAIDKCDGELAENATLNLADISYSLGHYEKAVDAYDALLNAAPSEEVMEKAKTGKMLSYFGNRQYLKAIKESESLRDASVYSETTRRQADYIAAKSYVVLGNRDAARPVFTSLSGDVSDLIGAESMYILIEDLYDSGDFTALEEKVYAFSDLQTPHMYWLAKSFIVLGDSFADRGDFAQARATYQSIADEYKPESKQDDVLEQVEMRLMKLSSLSPEKAGAK